MSYEPPATAGETATVDDVVATVEYLSLNHPKNYLGVPLAVAANEDTGAIINANLVRVGRRACRGAEALGLINHDRTLTPLGKHVVATVKAESSIEAELDRFAQMKGSTERFVDEAPAFWGELARDVLQEYPVAGDVVSTLEKTGPVTLAELATITARQDHPLATVLLEDADRLDAERLQHPVCPECKHADVYSGQGIYQLKTLLYHCGILTERGRDTSAVVPTQDVWRLEAAIMGGQR